MTDLVEFLRARLDDAEKHERDKYVVGGAVACPVCGRSTSCTVTSESSDVQFDCGHVIPADEFITSFGRSDADEFVLADVEAKRRIVEKCDNVLDGSAWDLAQATLRFLALPYASHPEYDESWRL